VAGPERDVLVAVGAYASAVVRCPPGSVTAVSRFEDGDRHAVHKVSYLSADGALEDVVVRVSFGGDRADGAQAEREACVLRSVGGRAAPRLYDFRCTSPWFDTPSMCMEFLPGSAQELGSAAPEDLERLGRVVAALHAHPVDTLAATLAEADDIASYAENRLTSILAGLAWVRAPLPAWTRDRLEGAAGALKTRWEVWRDAECFSTRQTLALLHGDIGPGNVLWSPDPALIDWEYTRLGDPADEIAYLFDQNGLAAPQRQAFWRGYRAGNCSQVHLAPVVDRVEWWERLTLFGSTLWWVERWVRRAEADAAGAPDPNVPRGQAYYVEQVTRRLDRLNQLLAWWA
jgi:aminoglycoside phosphotransferase (APT) family kinase protein